MLTSGRAATSRSANAVVCTRGHHSTPGRRGVQCAANSSDKESWPLGRFLQTVTFFNAPSDVLKGIAKTVLQPLQSDRGEMQYPYQTWLGEAAPGRGAVLVTGATGGVGRRVVAHALKRGARVRVLVRDLDKAAKLLKQLPASPSAVLEVVAADLSQPWTLRPEAFTNVRRVISCAAAKVQPKEGDDEQRSKYYNGITFYDPEIASDTPDAVERGGIEALLRIVSPSVGTIDGQSIFNPREVDSRWGPLDDVVMGGVSNSGIYLAPGAGPVGEDVALFRGNVSTANNGGFASVRSRNFEPAMDLGAYDGLRIIAKGDGNRYKVILRCDPAWDSVSYCLSVDMPDGAWATLDLPFADFKPVFRARSMPSAPPLDRSCVTSVQVMLSKFEYDASLNPSFTPGSFELAISSMGTYLPASAKPRIVHVSSAGVTRPGRPGVHLEQEPPAVRMNEALGGIMDAKLAGEDLIRQSGIPFAIVRPTALTEEPSGMPLVYEQGDTVKGKIGRDDVSGLCVHLLYSNAARNTTFEVSSTLPFSEPWTGRSDADWRREWEAELKAAQLAQGVTGKTVNGFYTGRSLERADATLESSVSS